MPKSRPPYPPEFRQRIIELVRKGRTPESLAEQFEPSAQTIRNWLAQADRDAGQRPDGLMTDEREAPPTPAGEQDPPRRTGDPKKSRGLVCQGDRLDPIQGFEFVTAHRATHRLATLCRVLGVLPQRVLCVAAAAAVGARPGRRHPGRPDSGDSYALARDLRGAPRARRVGGRRRARRPQARPPPDAGRRCAGREPPEASEHDAPRSRCRARARSGQPRLRCCRAGSALGGRHHLHPDLGGLPLSGRRPRRVESPCDRLGDGDAPADGARPRRVEHGRGAAAADDRDPPLRPGLSVHLDHLRAPLPRGGRPAVHGKRGRRL